VFEQILRAVLGQLGAARLCDRLVLGDAVGLHVPAEAQGQGAQGLSLTSAPGQKGATEATGTVEHDLLDRARHPGVHPKVTEVPSSVWPERTTICPRQAISSR
jgi:hypothetical protein